MIRQLAVIVALLATTCSATSAELIAFWQNNPITPEAIADDPTLAGMQSWSLTATNTFLHFHIAGMRAELPPGHTFYRNPLGGETRPTPQQVSAHPALAFQTYVTMPPDYNLGYVQPGVTSFQGQPISFGGPLDLTPGLLSVGWTNIVIVNTSFPGTWELARLTYPLDTIPQIDPDSYIRYFPDQFDSVPTTIPEPGRGILSPVTVLLLSVYRARGAVRYCL